MRSASTDGPKSNSWLPKVARSRPIALRAAIICAPWRNVDSTDGEIVSPASTKTVFGFSRLSSRTSVANRAMPPRRPPSTGPST